MKNRVRFKSRKRNNYPIFGLLCTLRLAVSVGGQWTSYVSPSFIDTSTNVTDHVGATVTLPCSVINLGTKKVVWKRVNEEHPLTIGDFVFTNDPRYYIDHPDRSYQWNLVIKDVTKNHVGEYECQISTKEEMHRKIKLTVIDLPPVDTDKAIQILGPNFTENGNPIRLICNATNNNLVPDFMDWFHNGRQLRASYTDGISITEYQQKETKTLYSILKIKKSSMDNAGTYICRNSRQDVVSHQVIVLNADSNHEKRGFQEKTGKKLSSSTREEPRNLADIHSKNYCSISNCLLLLLIISACNR